MKFNKLHALVSGLAIALVSGVLAQTGTGVQGPGVQGGGGGGGGAPGGSTFATQYKSGTTTFGGTGPGNSGEVLTSNGAGGAPTFQAASASFPGLTGDVTTPANSYVTTLIGGANMTSGTLGMAAAATVTSAGRALAVSAGPGGGTSGAGGALALNGGTATDGAGGGVTITARPGVGPTLGRAGGNVLMTAGAGANSGAGGQYVANAGAGGATGNGGQITFSAGAAGATAGAASTGGLVAFTAGASTQGIGGNVRLRPGTGGTTNGVVQLQTAGGTLTFLTNDNNANVITVGAMADQGFSRQTPTTGFSIVIPDNIANLVLAPSGTLATGTITMPANPINGQQVTVMTSQTITGLTVSPNTGQTIVAAPTTLTASQGGFSYFFCTADAKWYKRFGP